MGESKVSPFSKPVSLWRENCKKINCVPLRMSFFPPSFHRFRPSDEFVAEQNSGLDQFSSFPATNRFSFILKKKSL